MVTGWVFAAVAAAAAIAAVVAAAIAAAAFAAPCSMTSEPTVLIISATHSCSVFGILHPRLPRIGQFSARSKDCSSTRGSFLRTLAAFLSETEKPYVHARPAWRLRFLGKSMDCPQFSAAVLIFLGGHLPFETVGIPSHGSSLLDSASHLKNSRFRPSLLDSVR